MRTSTGFPIILPLALCLVPACAWNPNGDDHVKLRIDLGAPRAARIFDPGASLLQGMLPTQGGAYAQAAGGLPTDVNEFSCFLVNVAGPGIAASRSGSFGNLPPEATVINADQCTYEGITSTLAGAGSSEIELVVPSGPSRTVQVVGIAAPSGSVDGCTPGTSFEKYKVTQWETGNSFIAFNLGKTVTDLFTDSTVTVRSDYQQEGAFNCEVGFPLPLERVSYGGVNAPSGGWETPDLIWPPAPMVADLSGGAFPNLHKPDQSSVEFTSAAYPYGGRIDFLFDASRLPRDPAATGLHVEVIAQAGPTNGAACDFDDIQAGSGGFDVRVARVDGFWSSGMTQSGADVMRTRFSSYSDGNSVAQTYRTVHGGSVGGTPYVHVSVRALWNNGPGTCAVIRVKGIRAFYDLSTTPPVGL